MNIEGISPSRQAEVRMARTRRVVKGGLSMVGVGVVLAATRNGLGNEVVEAGAAVSFMGSFTATVAGARVEFLKRRKIRQVIEEAKDAAKLAEQKGQSIVNSARDRMVADGVDLVLLTFRELVIAIGKSNARQCDLRSSASKRSRLVLYRQSEE